MRLGYKKTKASVFSLALMEFSCFKLPSVDSQCQETGWPPADCPESILKVWDLPMEPSGENAAAAQQLHHSVMRDTESEPSS